MKKGLSLLFLVGLSCNIINAASTDEYVVDGLKYAYAKDNAFVGENLNSTYFYLMGPEDPENFEAHDLVIPASVNGISVHGVYVEAFKNNTKITGTITFPKDMNEISDAAFYGCTGITSLVLPTTTCKINERAFYGCTGITGTLQLDYIQTGPYAFANCTGITTLVVSKAANSFGQCNHLDSSRGQRLHTNGNTFAGCTSLQKIIHYGAPNGTYGTNFSDYNVPLYVESEYYTSYSSGEWAKFLNIKKLPNGMSLSASNLEIKVGQKDIITVQMQPSDADPSILEWTSEDPSIAIVENGIVTGVNPGQAIIDVSAGALSASCVVTVVEDTPQVGGGSGEWIEDGDSDASLRTRIYLTPDDEMNLTTVTSGLTVSTWTSTNDDVVEVTKRGIAYAYEFGEAVVRAKDTDGKTVAVIEVFVCPTLMVEHGDGVLYAHHVLYNSCPKVYLGEGGGYKIAGVTHDGTNITDEWITRDGYYTSIKPITDNSVINISLERVPESDPMTGTDSMLSESVIRLYVDGNTLTVTGADTGANVVITNLSGFRVYDEPGTEFKLIYGGVYLVNVEGETRTFKIIIR